MLWVEAAPPVAVETVGLHSATLMAQTWWWEGPKGPWAFPGPLWTVQLGPCLPPCLHGVVVTARWLG